MATNRIGQLLEFFAEDPSDPFVRFAIASEYLKVGDEESAVEWFEKLLEDQPDYLGTYYHLGKLYVRRGQVEDASRTFDGGIEAAILANDHHALSELRAARMEIEVDD